jgi:hypothetical protein
MHMHSLSGRLCNNIWLEVHESLITECSSMTAPTGTSLGTERLYQTNRKAVNRKCRRFVRRTQQRISTPVGTETESIKKKRKTVSRKGTPGRMDIQEVCSLQIVLLALISLHFHKVHSQPTRGRDPVKLLKYSTVPVNQYWFDWSQLITPLFLLQTSCRHTAYKEKKYLFTS